MNSDKTTAIRNNLSQPVQNTFIFRHILVRLISSNNNMLKGLTWQSLKANYSLIPLFSIVTVGMVMAFGHAFRCLAYSTDVKVNRRNPERPWEFTVNDDGSFKHAKYVRIHDYRKLKKSEYEPEIED